MAFVALRRTRNTRSYYLVESYRVHGQVKKRTLCYLGREVDGTSTIPKAITHWERVLRDLERRPRERADVRGRILLKRQEQIEERLRLLARYMPRPPLNNLPDWQLIQHCLKHPSAPTYTAVRAAFHRLALLYHPDKGGDHRTFVKITDAFEHAQRLCRVHRA